MYEEDFVSTLDKAAKKQEKQMAGNYDMTEDFSQAMTKPNSSNYEYQRKRMLALAMAQEAEEAEKVPVPKPTQGVGRTVVDQGLQGVPLVGTFSDEVTDALGSLIASTYLGYKKYAPNMLGGDDKYADIAVSPAAQYEEARKTTPERLEQQQEQNPGTSIASQLGTGVLTGTAALKAAGAAPSLFKGSEYVGKGATAVNDWLSRGNKIKQLAKIGATTLPIAGISGFGEGSGSLDDRWKNAEDFMSSPLNLAAGVAPFAGTAIKALNNIPGRAAMRAGLGYGAGKAYDLYNYDPENPEGSPNTAPTAAMLAAGLPMAGKALKTVAGAGKNVISPKIEKTVATLGDQAVNQYGIPLDRSDLGSNRANKMFTSVAQSMPMSGGNVSYDKKLRAWQREVNKTYGVDSDVIDGAAIKEGRKVGGDLFNQALDGLSVKLDDPAVTAPINKVIGDSINNLSNDQSKIVLNQVKKFLGQGNTNGWMDAKKLGSFRSDLNDVISSTSGDAKNYLKKLRDVVVDASVAGDPTRKAAINKARMNWKNLKTVEEIAQKAPDGMVTPSLLLNPTSKSFSGTFAAGGDSDLENLARIGKQFLTSKSPNSGTQERLMYEKALSLGILGGAGYSNPLYLLPTIATSAAYNALNRSQPRVKKAIAKALMPPKPVSPLRGIANKAGNLLVEP